MTPDRLSIVLGTVRSSVPLVWTEFVLYALRRWARLDLTPEDRQWAIAAAAVVYAPLYVAFRWVESRVPKAGWVLFGAAHPPTYLPPPDPGTRVG